jgi:hypothetical protein
VQSGGRLDAAGLERLADLRREFERLGLVSGRPDTDWPNWRRAHDSLWLLHHLSVASAPEPADEPDRPDR